MLLVKKLTKHDTLNYLKMLNELDKETRMMMYEVGERPQNLDALAEYLMSENQITLGVGNKEQLFGFVNVQPGKFRRTRHIGYVVLGLLESAQGSGYGQRMLKTAIKEARELGLKRLELTVMQTNSSAIRLYQKVGFKIEGEKKASMYVDGQYVDEWSMCYMIGESEDV